MSKVPYALFLLSLGIASIPTVQAQGSGLILEEVIVTATRRTSSLQDTPIAMTALTSSMLEDMDINSAFGLEAVVPSLSFQQSPNRLSIRGVGRFDNQLGTNPGVGIYTDGIYSSEASALSEESINVERIEVLRGPQGTLYGRNTTGGAINVITRRPTDEFYGDLRIKVGNYDLQQIDMLVSGPVNDDLRYKLYINDTQRDGLQENIAGPDLKSADNRFVEGQIEWDITPKLSLWAKYRENRYDYVPGAGAILGVNPSEDPYDCVNSWSGLNQSAQYLECQVGGTNPSVGDVRKFAQDSPGNVTLSNHHIGALQLTYDLPSATIKYLYGKVKYDWDATRVDHDQTPNDYGVLVDNAQYQDQETHELQLNSEWDKNWNYLLGLYFFSDENEQPYTIYADDYDNISRVTEDFVNFWDNPKELYYHQYGAVENESWASFGELSWDLNAEWAIKLGGRYSVDKFKGAETQIQYFDMARYGLGFALDVSEAHFAGDPDRYTDTVDARYKDEFENLTGKITVDYRPDDTHMIWGTVANGYKMGGVRLGSLEKFWSASAGEDGNGEFEQEDMLMLELGWKADLLNDRLRTEVVAFNYIYDDMQQTRQKVTPPPGSITLSEVINVDVETYGLEATATAILTDRLRAYYSFSYNHSEVSEDAYFTNRTYGARDENGNIIADNIKGNQLALTPEFKSALALHYTIPTNVGEFSVGGTYSYIGERYFNLENYDRADSYQNLDLQASWTSNTGRYRVLGSVKNATDETEYNTYACIASTNGEYGTDSFVTRCGGNLVDQRLYSLQFMISL